MKRVLTMKMTIRKKTAAPMKKNLRNLKNLKNLKRNLLTRRGMMTVPPPPRRKCRMETQLRTK